MKFWIKNIFLLMLGIGACAGSYYFAKSSVYKIRHWEQASAVVNVYESNTRKDVASFQYNGNTYSFTPLNASSRKGTAIFPKDDPTKAELFTYKNFFLTPLLIAFFGLVLIVIGFFSMQNRIAGKKVPPPSYDANPHFEALQNFVNKQDEARRKKDLDK